MITKGAKQSFTQGAGQLGQMVQAVGGQQEAELLGQVFELFGLRLHEGTFELSQTTEDQQVTLDKHKLLIGFVADENVVQIGNSFEVFGSLAKVNRDLGVSEGSTKVAVLAHDDLQVSHN